MDFVGFCVGKFKPIAPFVGKENTDKRFVLFSSFLLEEEYFVNK
jgi:hypothetical protein